MRVRERVCSKAHAQKDVIGQVIILASPVLGGCVYEIWGLGCMLRGCVCACECMNVCVRVCVCLCVYVCVCVRAAARPFIRPYSTKQLSVM